MKTPTPPAGTIDEVTEALKMLRRFDRQLRDVPHAMAAWIVKCLATQHAGEQKVDHRFTDGDVEKQS